MRPFKIGCLLIRILIAFFISSIVLSLHSKMPGTEYAVSLLLTFSSK